MKRPLLAAILAAFSFPALDLTDILYQSDREYIAA
jgi:hypothetical protein